MIGTLNLTLQAQASVRTVLVFSRPVRLTLFSLVRRIRDQQMKRSEKIAELQASRQKAIDDAQVIVALGTDSSLTEDQTKEVNELLDSAEQFGSEIEAVATEEAALAVTAQRLETLRTQPQNRQVAAIVNRGSQMSSMPDNGLQKVWKMPARARNHQKITAFSSDENYDAASKAYRFGMFALAKAQLDCPGAYNFPTATKFAREHGLLNASHMEGGSDTTGSHIFVPEEFGQDMIKLREQYGVARQICKVRTMTSDTRTDPKWESGLTAYFTGEGAAATSSTMVHSTVRLTAKKLTVLSTFSSELNEDAVVDIGNELANEGAYAFALKEDQCLIDGDGTSTYGHIVGLKNSFYNNLTITTNVGYRDATGTTWGAITLADITSLISVVPVYAQQGMYFLCSSQFYYQVMVPLLNAAGGISGMELQDGFRVPAFQGIRVMFSQVMPIATATTGIVLFLGNFAQGVTLGDRRRQTIEFSRDATVDSVNLFTNDLIAIKSSERLDINVHSYGSGATAGPIVALATAAP